MFNNHVRKTFIKHIVTNCNVRLKSLTMHYINQLIFQEVYLILWSLSTKIIQNKTPQKTFKNRKGSLDVGASTRTAWDIFLRRGGEILLIQVVEEGAVVDDDG